MRRRLKTQASCTLSGVSETMRINLPPILLGAIVLAHSAFAQAQATGFDVNRFDVAEAGSDWFSADSLDLRGHLRPSVQVTGEYAYKPLVRYDENGNEVAPVIKHQAQAHLGVGMVLAERVRLALSMPVLRWNRGDDVTVNGTLFSAEAVAVGDLRLAADLRLIGNYGDPFIAAVGAQLHVPTGDEDAFTSDGKVRIAPRLLVAGDLGPVAYSARVAYRYRGADQGFGDVPTGSELTFVASAGLRLARRRLVIGPEIWGSTVAKEGAMFKRLTSPLELIFGVHYRFSGVRLGLGAGPGLTRGLGSPTWRGLAHVSFTPEVDTDKDGIFDEDDACPKVPGAPSTDPDKHGCPPDRDGDGIGDPVDACPDVPGVENDDPKKNGCPSDRDDDGVFDTEDACPDVPGLPSTDPKKNGCPTDRDGDGIFDAQDACPDLPGIRDDNPEKNGCPPDRDGDGVWDEDDACPDTPGVRSKDPKQNGCPVAAIVKDQIKIYQRIEFVTDSAKLLVSSEVVLSAVMDILLKHSEIELVMVEGHTDNVGAAEYNRLLSQRRAASVVGWLVKHGISADRLQSAGRGLTQPLVPNTDAVGRQTNRRVEFHILKFKGKPATDSED